MAHAIGAEANNPAYMLDDHRHTDIRRAIFYIYILAELRTDARRLRRAAAAAVLFSVGNLRLLGAINVAIPREIAIVHSEQVLKGGP